MTTHIDVHGSARHSSGTAGGRGGQYAAKHNSAPAGALAEDTFDAPKRSSELTAEAIRESQEIMARTAHQITRTFRIDSTNADDIVQDSWVHLLERDSRHDDIADRVKERAFLNLTARKYANDYGNDARFGLRSEEFRARRKLRALAEAFAAEHGRKMTPGEYEAAAGEIRMSYKAGQRPKPDYFREISQLTLDARISHDDGPSLGDTIERVEQPGFDDQEDAAALALHALENVDEVSKDTIRNDMWRIMSLRVQGAPQPVADSLDAEAVSAHRRLVKRAGGAHRLALAWLDGETTKEQEEALFAPFGELDLSGRSAVLDVLDNSPKYADRLWASSLAAASR